MPTQNPDIAEMFRRMANLLELEDANPFRVRAYRNAARTLASLPRDVADMIAAQEKITALPGIGADLAAKVREAVETGSIRQLEELEERMPAGLNQLLNIPGLGPKRVKALYRQLEITSIPDLREAAEKHEIRRIEGFGSKLEQSIAESAAQAADLDKRISLQEAGQRAAPIVAHLEASKGVMQVVVAGSYRRCRETVGDLDILVSAKAGGAVMKRFTRYEDVDEIISRGDTRSTAMLRSGLQVDVRVLPPDAFGAALHYFTGSKAHNIAIRKRAGRQGLKINEYGVFRGEERVAGKTEKEVFDAVGLPFIDPALREDAGEIQAAEAGRLPHLVEMADIRGDLHAHTAETDGQSSLEEMARAARDRGYDYLAVTDHSPRLAMTNGLDADRLAAQIARIDALNGEFGDGFQLLKGIEVDILADGCLDLPDEILRQLDLRVCSVHTAFDLSRKKQTDRILKAMENPYFNILGHPTGRLIGKREAYAVDLEKIMTAAREKGCFLELNAGPERLDLTDTQCRMARDIGVKVAISTDAHNAGSLAFMRYGICQARRGWLSPDAVINTRGRAELLDLMQRD